MDGVKVIRAAQSWIGTPYQHQASVIGIGADCLGLVRGIWRETVGVEPDFSNYYSPYWFEVDHGDSLLNGLRCNFEETNVNPLILGGVLAFRFKSKSSVKHLGIVSSIDVTSPRIIHSYERKGVIESPLNFAWRRRVAAQFKFPKKV